MAKDKLTDYDSTASGNLDVGGISVAEGMLPSGVNNAIRELMSHQADAFGAGTPLYVDQTNNRLGVGTISPSYNVDIQDSSTPIMRLKRGTTDTDLRVAAYGVNTGGLIGTYTNSPFLIYINSAEAARIDSSGNVGIGTNSPSNYGRLAVMTPTATYGYFGIGNSVGGGGGVNIGSYYGTTKISYIDTVLENGTPASEQSRLQFATISGGTLAEAMRIDSSGNLLVGTTTGGGTIGTYNGFGALSGGTIFSSATSNRSVFARRSTDGSIIDFRKDGTTVGSIGAVLGDIYINTGNTGLRFYDVTNQIIPVTSAGANRDNAIDLGNASVRFDDIFATNGTIQTSDANEKQQIAALTDAEITAAKAISQLFKTFKWNSAVTEKGDAARTHAGVIAQDVEAAMTAAGLDAGDYAFFISSTWWETQTEVPAVEAVEAVDAVYEDVVIPAVEEELDEDGNVIVEAQPERTEKRLVSEAVEAVEAVAAYTRTDTYETAEEAPEGAVERTRMGIRYPELLAFVGAATEQRLANIETRLAALEAN